jgi:hypothetical protein
MTATIVANRTRRPRRQHYQPITPRGVRKAQSISSSYTPDVGQGGEIAMLFDEMDRLAEVRPLYELLVHYASLGADNREAWQDRLTELEGLDARQLVRLHGELLAYGWIEQNTGLTPVLRHGFAPLCYRVTAPGLKAVKQARSENMHAA